MYLSIILRCKDIQGTVLVFPVLFVKFDSAYSISLFSTTRNDHENLHLAIFMTVPALPSTKSTLSPWLMRYFAFDEKMMILLWKINHILLYASPQKSRNMLHSNFVVRGIWAYVKSVRNLQYIESSPLLVSLLKTLPGLFKCLNFDFRRFSASFNHHRYLNSTISERNCEIRIYFCLLSPT